MLFFLLGCVPSSSPAPAPVEAPPAPPPPSVVVWRSGRTVFLLDETGQILHSEPIGIGRGGLRDKDSMDDLVTPTGTFVVDLVLHRAHARDAVAPEAVRRFAGDPAFAELLSGETGLAKLFENMNSIDFDGDGAADAAYGAAYIGLDGDQTGPKMRLHGRSGTPYWYSIALHGTPDPENLGAASSGGCVHVGESLLERLITERILQVGSRVRITDEPPL